LQAWEISVLTISARLQFDVPTPHEKTIASVMATLAEFEYDLIRERIKSGTAAGKARGKQLERIVELAKAGLSEPLIGVLCMSDSR